MAGLEKQHPVRADKVAPSSNNNERFTEQQYSLFTIEKFTWLVDRPMQPVRVVGPSSSNARCQWTPADNPRVCLKVVSLKLLGGSDGPIYKDGQRLQHLEQSNTTAAWAQGCSDRAMENVREFDRERKKRRGLPSSPVALQKQGTKPPLGPVDTGLEKPAFRRTKEDMVRPLLSGLRFAPADLTLFLFNPRPIYTVGAT